MTILSALSTDTGCKAVGYDIRPTNYDLEFMEC